MGAQDALLIGFVTCCQSLFGIFVTPYQTLRRVIERQNPWELVYIGLLLAGYFLLASLVKVAAFRPFLLTKQFVLLGAATGMNYILMSVAIYLVSKWFGGQGSFPAVAIGWAYTLIPTVAWFLATSLLYVALPPPRTASLAGISFSILFLVFSATLLFWKVILSYLVVRFGMRLTLPRIVATYGVIAPFIAAYSVAMYRWGIFKVPFI